MQDVTLNFRESRVRLDGIKGLYCEDDTFDIKVLDTVSPKHKSEVVDNSCLVSKKRGRTFPYIFQLIGNSVCVKVQNPTIGLEVNDKKLTGQDTIHLSSDTKIKIGDISFELVF